MSEAKFRDLGHGALLVRMHCHGRAKEGSSELEGTAAAVVRFRGERMVSVDVLFDEEHALASVAS